MPRPAGGEEAVPLGHDTALQQQQGEQEDRPSDVSLAGNRPGFPVFAVSVYYLKTARNTGRILDFLYHLFKNENFPDQHRKPFLVRYD